MVKYRVIGADGRYRGGIFEAGPWLKSWTGRPKDGCLETMFCSGSIAEGSWYLLAQSTSPDLTGDESTDDLMDHNSHICHRTVPQAFRWFSEQDSGPPPLLVKRAKGFKDKWDRFMRSQEAQDLLFDPVEFGDPYPTIGSPRGSGGQGAVLELLLDLDLVVATSSGDVVDYKPSSFVRDMGRSGSMTWMDDQVSFLRDRLGKARETVATSQPSDLPGISRDKPSAVDAWKPSVHQGIVLALLKRDGRLQTGVLWQRLVPKHIEKRAHQNAMRDLVARNLVKTAGKGRGTEYWLA